MDKSTFGQFIREKRVEMGKTLREFCKDSGYDLGYISRLENGILQAPESDSKLRNLAEALKVKLNTKEWELFMDLASISRRRIPKDINVKVISHLPAFFRKASKKRVTKKDVENLLSLIKGGK